jgi:RNA polymerase sigma factor (sigma-70 family)
VVGPKPLAPDVVLYEPMIDQRRQGTTDFADLYAAEAPRLWRAMFAFTGSRETASDVVAETFAQCLRRGAEVQAPALWLWRSAFRIAVGELSDSQRYLDAPIDVAREDEVPDLDLMIALGRLSRRQRLTIILHYYAGYSTPEIARIMGVAVSTVRVHLMQGRRRLRHMLGGFDD